MSRKTKPAKAPPAGNDAGDARFALVVEAFAGDPRVTTGKMFGSIGVRVDGKVFSMAVKGRLVAKLPKERVDALVASGAGAYFDPGHGKLMKEWVAIAGARPPWVEIAREAYRFVRGGKA